MLIWIIIAIAVALWLISIGLLVLTKHAYLRARQNYMVARNNYDLTAQKMEHENILLRNVVAGLHDRYGDIMDKDDRNRLNEINKPR